MGGKGERNQRFCISRKLPDDADVVDLRVILGGSLDKFFAF